MLPRIPHVVISIIIVVHRHVCGADRDVWSGGNRNGALHLGRRPPCDEYGSEEVTHRRSEAATRCCRRCVPVWDFFKPDPSFDYPTVDGALSQGTLRLPTIGAFMSRPKGRLRDCYARKQAQASKPLKKRSNRTTATRSITVAAVARYTVGIPTVIELWMVC